MRSTLPSATWVNTAARWAVFDRKVKPGTTGVSLKGTDWFDVADTDSTRTLTPEQQSAATACLQAVAKAAGAVGCTFVTSDLSALTSKAQAYVVRERLHEPNQRGFFAMRLRAGQFVMAVNPELDDAQKAQVAAHELGHVRLHRARTHVTRWLTSPRREIEAETFCWLLCDHYGFAEPRSFQYIKFFVDQAWCFGDWTLRNTRDKVLPNVAKLV